MSVRIFIRNESAVTRETAMYEWPTAKQNILLNMNVQFVWCGFFLLCFCDKYSINKMNMKWIKDENVIIYIFHPLKRIGHFRPVHLPATSGSSIENHFHIVSCTLHAGFLRFFSFNGCCYSWKWVHCIKNLTIYFILVVVAHWSFAFVINCYVWMKKKSFSIFRLNKNQRKIVI